MRAAFLLLIAAAFLSVGHSSSNGKKRKSSRLRKRSLSLSCSGLSDSSCGDGFQCTCNDGRRLFGAKGSPKSTCTCVAAPSPDPPKPPPPLPPPPLPPHPPPPPPPVVLPACETTSTQFYVHGAHATGDAPDADYVYRTLYETNIAGTEKESGFEEQVYRALPEGFEISPDHGAASPGVAGKHIWNSYRVRCLRYRWRLFMP